MFVIKRDINTMHEDTVRVSNTASGLPGDANREPRYNRPGTFGLDRFNMGWTLNSETP